MLNYKFAIFFIALAVGVWSCGTARSGASSLERIVERDAIIFEIKSLPDTLISRMADHRVVFLGEEHNVMEHQELVLSVVKALHAHGARTLLLEGFHAESQWIDGFVAGRLDELPPATERVFGHLLRALRCFNEGRSDTDRMRAMTVDIDHRVWAFPASLAKMGEGRELPAVAQRFLSESGWTEGRETFVAAVQVDRDAYLRRLTELAEVLGDDEVYAEMVDVALRSFKVRGVWETEGEDAAHPLREEVIKAIVDRRISEADGPVLINMGGYHAQKLHVMGTPKVWLGEYLRSPSSAAQGSVFNIMVIVGSGERLVNGVVESYVADPDDLVRTLRSVHGEKPTFLPLDDSFFSAHAIAVNYGGHVVEGPPFEQYDSIVLLYNTHLSHH